MWNIANVVALALTYALMLAVSSIPLGLVMWGCARLARSLPPRRRTAALVVAAGTLFMPVWGPATIAVVPVPLGLILLLSAALLDFQGLAGVLGLTPAWWYPCGFAATALVAYAALRLFSRPSSRPTPLRGAEQPGGQD